MTLIAPNVLHRTPERSGAGRSVGWRGYCGDPRPRIEHGDWLSCPCIAELLHDQSTSPALIRDVDARDESLVDVSEGWLAEVPGDQREHLADDAHLGVDNSTPTRLPGTPATEDTVRENRADVPSALLSEIFTPERVISMRRLRAGVQDGGVHRLRLWLKVACQRTGLDMALANGADPDGDPALGLRAEQLTSLATRRAIATTLRNLVDAAEEPPEMWGKYGPRPPLQGDDILEASEDLLALARSLRSAPAVAPRGAALAALLVWDCASPIYTARTDATVTQWAHTALASSAIDVPPGRFYPTWPVVPVRQADA